MFLDALADRLGEADARRVFADLREANDPESAVSVPGSFPQQAPVVARARQRRPRRRQLHGRAARGACVRLERAARRGEAVGDRAPAVRRRPSGRLLLPGVLRGDGAHGRRLRRARRRCSPACRSCSSAAARTSRGAPRRHRPTTSTCSSRRCAKTTSTTCTGASASRCAGSSSGRSRRRASPTRQVSYDETTHGPVIGYAKVGGKRVAISLAALDARSRAALDEGVLRPEHRAASTRRRTSSRR